jgi:hypothetical protein
MALDRGRYYAVTGEALDGASMTLRTVSVDDVRWFLHDAGPRFQQTHGDGSGQQRTRDESGAGTGGGSCASTSTGGRQF